MGARFFNNPGRKLGYQGAQWGREEGKSNSYQAARGGANAVKLNWQLAIKTARSRFFNNRVCLSDTWFLQSVYIIISRKGAIV